MVTCFSALFFSAFLVQVSLAQQPKLKPWEKAAQTHPDWVTPEQPFKVIENIYYVGTKGIASYLITSDQGHIILDGGMPQNAVLIADSVKTLGYKLSDVKILLNSHAHFDHSGGLAELKQLSGATLIASNADTHALETGLYPGSEDLKYSAPPVTVDKNVAHQESISLGDISMQANITPGHTPGCTSWTTTVGSESKEYDVLFFCSASVAGNRLVGPPQYPGIVDDYRLTFERTKEWQPDVLLSNHPFFFGMKEKRETQRNGDELAFVDKTAFQKLITHFKAGFEESLNDQKKKLRALENQ